MPRDQKEVKQYLELAGYYCRSVSDYSVLTSPLTNLTKKGHSDPVLWTMQHRQVAVQIKTALYGGHLLHSCDSFLPFVLQRDGGCFDHSVGGKELLLAEPKYTLFMRTLFWLCHKHSQNFYNTQTMFQYKEGIISPAGFSEKHDLAPLVLFQLTKAQGN